MTRWHPGHYQTWPDETACGSRALQISGSRLLVCQPSDKIVPGVLRYGTSTTFTFEACQKNGLIYPCSSQENAAEQIYPPPYLTDLSVALCLTTPLRLRTSSWFSKLHRWMSFVRICFENTSISAHFTDFFASVRFCTVFWKYSTHYCFTHSYLKKKIAVAGLFWALRFCHPYYGYEFVFSETQSKNGAPKSLITDNPRSYCLSY